MESILASSSTWHKHECDQGFRGWSHRAGSWCPSGRVGGQAIIRYASSQPPNTFVCRRETQKAMQVVGVPKAPFSTSSPAALFRWHWCLPPPLSLACESVVGQVEQSQLGAGADGRGDPAGQSGVGQVQLPQACERCGGTGISARQAHTNPYFTKQPTRENFQTRDERAGG